MAVPEADLSSDFDYSPAYLTSQYVLVARAGSHIRRRSGLKGKTLGVAVVDEDVLYQNQKFVDSMRSRKPRPSAAQSAPSIGRGVHV